MKDIIVNNIESFGTQDGPGIRMVVFTQGCLMNCLYCQNPDTIPIEGGTPMAWQELFDKAMKQKEYFGAKGGVTISGGEPLLHAEALIPLFEALHKEGLSTALDTNGFIWNKYVEELVNNTDYILLDIKHINPEIHKKLTGVSIAPVLNFAEKMKYLKKHLWVRYVLLPEWNDSDEYLHAWAKYVKTLHAERIEVLPYHTLGIPKYQEMHKEYKLEGVPTPSNELKEKTKKIFKEEGLINIVIK